ncbi:MAG: hypothetical protein GXP30_07370 [Verrucomicrobia bacterium]|nr:hypothetical protein [Verrucomicrobiota bacterium]
MPERPAPTAQGTIRNIREPQRLFEVEMPNGFRSLAVLPHGTPSPPPSPLNQQVEVKFSPYDMSQCKIIRWL